jgi:hypothetical protein
MSFGINGVETGNGWNNPYIAAYTPGGKAAGEVAAATGVNAGQAGEAEKSGPVRNPGEDTVKKPGRTSAPSECKTCSNRRYQDGSNENVSYKAPTKISPEAAGSAVRAHEQEHVANAYKKAAQNNGKVISANVSIKMSICPECGRSYVSGGETTTKIRYTNEEQPYQKNKKQYDAAAVIGMNFDKSA